MAEIRIHRRAAAPLETVWDVLYDQVGMSSWVPIVSIRLEREGDPPPNGVGAIRAVSRRPVKVREQITAVDAPTRLAYRMLSGLPVRDYVGETTLTADGSATDILWTISFSTRVPGMAFVDRQVIGLLVKGLVKEAERRARSSSPGASQNEAE